jgi:hypothetical protein
MCELCHSGTQTASAGNDPGKNNAAQIDDSWLPLAWWAVQDSKLQQLPCKGGACASRAEDMPPLRDSSRDLGAVLAIGTILSQSRPAGGIQFDAAARIVR